MSGHSKWNNIKHKKEKSDAAKAKIFTKIGKEMAVAIKAGGPDPNNNSKLRDLIAKAKANNVPNDNIQRTIKKFSDNSDINFEEIVYEGYGPSGVAIIVETSTDNRNRTAGNVRANFSKYGGNLGQNGCVGYLFEEKGVITIVDEDGEIDGGIFDSAKLKFTEALDNDLNTSLAVTALYDVFKLDTNAKTKLALIRDFERVLDLGLIERANKLSDSKKKADEDGAPTVSDELLKYIESKIAERRDAKKAKNFALADSIRDELLAKGITLLDTREGTKFTIS